MSGVVLVLAHAHDAGASRVVERLAERLGPGALAVVRPESLGLARWRHMVSAGGRAHTVIELPSGESLRSDDISVALNRLQYLPVPRFHRAPPRDRDYAGAELQALVASWLLSLGDRVINPVGPRAQSRGPLATRGWLALAARVGLPVARSARATAGRMLPPLTPRERLSGTAWPGGTRGPAPAELIADSLDSGSVLVAGDDSFGPLAERFGADCIALTRLAQCVLIEVRFIESSQGEAVCALDPLPPLLQDWEAEVVARYVAMCWERRHPVGPAPKGRRRRCQSPEIVDIAGGPWGPGRQDVGAPSESGASGG